MKIGDRVKLVESITESMLEMILDSEAGKVFEMIKNEGGIGAVVTYIAVYGMCYMQEISCVIPIEYLEVMQG